MKKLVMCDDVAYHITDRDFEKLRRISPGLARLASHCKCARATHFVCEACGQVSPVRLRRLHSCSDPR